MALKLNIGQKDGKTVQKDITDDNSKSLMGKKIGDKVKGDKLGFPGYEFKITGGSDKAGFPMRQDVEGTARKRVLITKGVGFQGKRKGLRKRRTVAGNTIYDGTVQVNVKVEKKGKAPIEAGEAPAESEDSEEDTGKEKKEPEKKADKESKEKEKKEESDDPEKDEDNAKEEASNDKDETKGDKEDSADEEDSDEGSDKKEKD